ncbi:related to serum paraoxonase/arylesterase [Rhynchosporium secalis]|uniref:Related to serum paraoxonase/arylesterase n=1 Tax=Rhynchosporium secalis TaxID=38038 RepID=A0A1E1M3R6_RHYSE|nr:related to serum paraoxonase/arylesterase [Rhynchosporium secalis]
MYTEFTAERYHSGDKLDISARDFNDHVSVLNIDHPGSDGLYGLQKLEIIGNYVSASGGKETDVHGIAMEVISPTRLRFWLNNHRPSTDPHGTLLDGKKVGANSTIEVFEHTRGSTTMEHVRTISHEAASTPNGLLATGDGGVYVTNDHDSKIGKLRMLEMLFGGGSVTYCILSGSCNLAATHGFKFANGITGLFSTSSKNKNQNQVIYVANSAKGFISTHIIQPNGTLFRGKDNHLGMPVDNLSIDSAGDIFAACFPDVLALVANMDGPVVEPRREIGSTVFRIRRISDGMGEGEEEGTIRPVVEKVLEDLEGKVLPGATTAVHDVKTGSIWLGGVISPLLLFVKG